MHARSFRGLREKWANRVGACCEVRGLLRDPRDTCDAYESAETVWNDCLIVGFWWDWAVWHLFRRYRVFSGGRRVLQKWSSLEVSRVVMWWVALAGRAVAA